MPKTADTDRICIDCWNRALDAYGTAKLFLKRSRRETVLLRVLSFWGLVLPVLIGAVVIGFGTKVDYLQKLLDAAALAGIVQIVLSLWSIVASWADNLQYSLESAAENFDLSSKFKELGEQAQNPPDYLASRYAELKGIDDSRRKADAKKGVSQRELRYAHRAGLRQFQRACEGCKEVPLSMNSTKCHICGKLGLFGLF